MPRRPIRIGNCSGAINDGIDQVYRLAKANVDAITGDYLAEFNIAWKAIELQSNPELGYETSFLDQLAWHNGDAARLVAQNKIKVVNDGGALNPAGLAREVDRYFKSLGIGSVRVAWVEGDNVTAEVKQGKFGKIQHLDQVGHAFDETSGELLAANAYTGQAGIVEALEEGADIVICGRCCDASPVMGLASWWHGWSSTAYDELASSLMAGHLIECGSYVCGGNYCGQPEVASMIAPGFPIAEIDHTGVTIITKPEGSSGAVTVDTCKAQALYEIQGTKYLNLDVIADIEQIQLGQVGKDRVRLAGVKGSPPPPTAKLAICLLGGYQAELSTYAAGLDTDYKFNLYKSQVMSRLNKGDFTTISIEKYGTAAPNPKSQRDCTVMIRLFVQSPKKEAIQDFKRAVFYNGISGYCGLHIGMDWRTAEPRPYVKYFPGLMPQELLKPVVYTIGGHRPTVVPGRSASECSSSVPRQLSYDASGPSQIQGLYETVYRPLGDLAFGRSGDKGGNANCGLWVRDEKAWPWLRAFLSISRLKSLLADDWDDRYTVERCEFPNLWAVHFVVKGILQEGVSSSSVLDGFAKSFGEFIRARSVDVPRILLDAEEEKRRRMQSLASSARL